MNTNVNMSNNNSNRRWWSGIVEGFAILACVFIIAICVLCEVRLEQCGVFVDNRPLYNTVEFKQPPFFTSAVEITGWRYCPKRKDMLEVSYTYKKDGVPIEVVIHTPLDNVIFIVDDNYYLK